MDSRELIAERVKLWEENKRLLDRAGSRTLTGEEQAAFNRRDERITEIRRTLDANEKTEAEDRWLSQSRGRQTSTEVRSFGGPPATAELALRAWALGPRNARPEHIEAADRLGLRYNASELELRALSAGNTSGGGYSVPDDLMAAFWDASKSYGRVENLSTVLNTTSGADLPVPTTDDTSNAGEIITEGSAVTTTVDPSFGQVVLQSFKYSSKAVIVSVELLQDSSINLPQYLGRALGTRIGRIKNTHFTTGDASSKPNGVVTASTVGKTAAATNAFTLDEVLDLIHSVDASHRDRPTPGS